MSATIGPARTAVRTATLTVLAALAAGAAAGPATAQAPTPATDEMTEVVRAVEGLDAMRSRLARTFTEGGAAADRETFRAVCAPVGRRARRVADEQGWRLEQLSEKFRNPDHRPDPEARSVLRRMEADSSLTAVWRRSRVEGRRGWRYFRRIVVEPSCLACHGAEEERPDFVKRGYPQDRAHGFRPGDLRGVYSVFVPEDTTSGSKP